jgi:hypothetical protein
VPGDAGDGAGAGEARRRPEGLMTVTNSETTAKLYTSKQMGDACEMLVAAELTLAGMPALKVPDNWPGYDVIAQPPDASEPLRISVKSRTFKTGQAFVSYQITDKFNWLAVVLLKCDTEPRRRIFLIPRAVADDKARKNKPTATNPNERYWRIDEIAESFPQFEDNFCLSLVGHSDRHSQT